MSRTHPFWSEGSLGGYGHLGIRRSWWEGSLTSPGQPFLGVPNHQSRPSLQQGGILDQNSFVCNRLFSHGKCPLSNFVRFIPEFNLIPFFQRSLSTLYRYRRHLLCQSMDFCIQQILTIFDLLPRLRYTMFFFSGYVMVNWRPDSFPTDVHRTLFAVSLLLSHDLAMWDNRSPLLSFICQRSLFATVSFWTQSWISCEQWQLILVLFSASSTRYITKFVIHGRYINYNDSVTLTYFSLASTSEANILKMLSSNHLGDSNFMSWSWRFPSHIVSNLLLANSINCISGKPRGLFGGP